MEVGDTVLVITHTHKQQTGIICHITANNSLFINFGRNGTNRIRILSKDIGQCIELKTKVSDTKNCILSASEIQSYIASIVQDNGCNYDMIGRNYEIGSDGFPINFNKAMNWYLSGHKLENIQCTVQLANISANYYHNFDVAEKYWNIGIDDGYIFCAYNANVMFRNNKQIKNAKNKELYYIKKFIQFTNGKHCGSLLDFAVCQLTMNVPDYFEAFKYLQNAYEINPNSIGIQQFLAIVLYRGLGCEKNENRAIEIHRKLAIEHKSECSKLWIAVYNAINYNNNNNNNIHPLCDILYNSFMDIIDNGDSHNLYYGNWIKIIEYHSFNKKDIMSCCLFIALKIFGFLECVIDIKQAKKCVIGLIQNNSDCIWIKSWIWFFGERYNIIKQITGIHDGLIDLITEIELSIYLTKKHD